MKEEFVVLVQLPSFKIDFLDFKSLKMSRKVDNKYITSYENLDIPCWYECDGILTYIAQLKYK